MEQLNIMLGTNPAMTMVKDAKVLGIHRTGHQRLDFPAAGYVVKAVKDSNDRALFGLVNMWLDSLTTDERNILYTMYCRGKNTIVEVTTYKTVNDRLTVIFNDAAEVLNIGKVAAWLDKQPGDPAAYRGTIEAYPEDQEHVDDYVEGSSSSEVVHRPGTPVKTLVRTEVRDLIAAAMVSKLMAPLFCEYINKFRMVFQRMLEMQLFTILQNLELFKHPIFPRLYEYVEAFLKDSDAKSELGIVVHNYMSEDEYADYVISLIFCNRLMNAPLEPGPSQRTFIPNVISTAVRDACNPASLFSEKRHKEKEDNKSASNRDEGKRSEFERISVGFTLSPGQQEMSDWGVTRFLMRELSDCNTHKRLTVYDKKLVDYYLSQDRSDVLNQNAQKTLMSIIVDEFFPRSMFDQQTKKSMDQLYAVAAIWLHQNGYEQLAKLQTARGAVDQTYMCGTPIRQWSEDDLHTLAKLYPSRPAPSIGRPVPANLGMTEIDKLLKEFVTLRWSSGTGSGETVEPPHRFRSQIVEIILKRGT